MPSLYHETVIYLIMLIPCLNPRVPELNKTHRQRTCSPSLLKPILIEGIRFCTWCGLTELTGSKLKKYCSDKCCTSVMAWGYPQGEEGLASLLARQGYFCLICHYDYNPLADSILGKYGVPKSLDRLTIFHHKFIKILKSHSSGATLPEVDHELPISKGGQAIGLENVRAICRNCHKIKSKVDNSGPRKKLTNPPSSDSL